MSRPSWMEIAREVWVGPGKEDAPSSTITCPTCDRQFDLDINVNDIVQHCGVRYELEITGIDLVTSVEFPAMEAPAADVRARILRELDEGWAEGAKETKAFLRELLKA